MRVFFCLLILFFLSLNSWSQKQDSLDLKVYHVRPQVDIPLTVAALATDYWGLQVVRRKAPLDSITIINLDANNINRFDRSATRQDAAYAPQAQRISDYGMYVSYGLPLLFLIDKKIRKDWAEVFLLYFQAEAIAGNLYSWGCAIHIDRIRPLVYHPDVPWGEKTGGGTKNSFHSGHTSASAAASFFVAKVFCDYHPEWGNKKYLVYAAAAIPPIFTGYHRYKGMKHFPTDVITGLVVGATTGILVPHLHKHKHTNLAIIPVAGSFNGFAMKLKF